MAILKLLGWQGIAGLVVAVALGILLVVQTGKTNHWKKQSGHFEQLYQQEQTAYADTVAGYRAAATQATQVDAENAARVVAEQKQINERSRDELQTRLADARATIQRLQSHLQTTANSGGPAKPSVSVIPTPTCGTDSPALDPAARAYDCAIQLDELIKWTKSQAKVNIQGNNDDNSKPAARSHD